jgi:hypothetical protein
LRINSGKVATHQKREDQKEAAQLGLELSRLQGELAPIGHGGCGRAVGIGAILIFSPRQASKAFIVQNLPDGGATEGCVVVLEGALNVVDGEILFAHSQNEVAGGALLGLGARAGLEVLEKGGFSTAEMVTENAEGAWGVAEALGDLLGGGAFQKVGAQGLILALGGGGWLQEEPGLFC